jgi:hypothetical protein
MILFEGRLIRVVFGGPSFEEVTARDIGGEEGMPKADGAAIDAA